LLTTHLKLATPFYTTQLCDILAYEVLQSTQTLPNQFPKSSTKFQNNWSKAQNTIIIYNFHTFYTQNRFFLFTQTSKSFTKSKFLKLNDSSDSIAEMFPAANWLEREVSELHGVNFAGKKDLRNLMLQYGDTTSPFQKLFPSIGVKELFYDPLKDTLVQKNVTVQL
jgi:NADH:ubiquinone oxidoreductase subunit C